MYDVQGSRDFSILVHIRGIDDFYPGARIDFEAFEIIQVPSYCRASFFPEQISFCKTPKSYQMAI
jgi:hypothetical protein